jgi:hypothetical protein
LTFTIPLFHERPTQSNLKQRFKKRKRKVFYGEQPIEVATTIIALICSMMSLKTESIKSTSSYFLFVLGNNHLKQIMYNPENGVL